MNITRYLLLHPEVVASRPYGFDMLQRALRGTTELDPHHYPDLSGS
jgi:hypothetical protein